MSTHTAINICAFCGEEVSEGEECVLVEKVIGTKMRPITYYNPKEVPDGKLRINHLGGKRVSPKNLIHVACWNKILEYGVSTTTKVFSELRAR